MLKGKGKGKNDADILDGTAKKQQVQPGLAMLHQFEKQRADDGKLSKSGADEAAGLTVKQNPIFSSISVVKDSGNWGYNYVIQRVIEKSDFPIDEDNENISKATKKKMAQIFKIYPIGSGKCDVCARRVYRILAEAGHKAQIGRMDTSYPSIVTINNISISIRLGSSPAYHEFVRVGNTIFDAITGENGMIWSEYAKLFYDDVFDDGTIRITYFSL